jgi:RNase P protein component
LMREAFRACAEQIHRPGAYVLVARARTGNRELSRMTGELRELLTRMDLYQKEAGTA